LILSGNPGVMAVDLFTDLIVHSSVQLLTRFLNGGIFRFLDLLSDRSVWRRECERLIAMLDGLLIILVCRISTLGGSLSGRGRLISSVGPGGVRLYGLRWGWIQAHVFSAAAIADMHLPSPSAARSHRNPGSL
jgi:hypothetical protein